LRKKEHGSLERHHTCLSPEQGSVGGELCVHPHNLEEESTKSHLAFAWTSSFPLTRHAHRERLGLYAVEDCMCALQNQSSVLGKAVCMTFHLNFEICLSRRRHTSIPLLVWSWSQSSRISTSNQLHLSSSVQKLGYRIAGSAFAFMWLAFL
jgi:hypothetical protein